ncbi:nitrogenase subunit NifH (ATPase)-like protein, partial [mine drainage metagenome]
AEARTASGRSGTPLGRGVCRLPLLPPYRTTNWNALVLADLGLDRHDRGIRTIAERIVDYKLRLSSPFNFFHEEVCIVGNTARMLTRFGFGDDPKVRRLYDWLLDDQRADGGWSCAQGTPGTLDAWEALAAFAVIPKAERSPRMDRAIERGAEFYLGRRLFQEGKRYAPWFRLHFPTHYFYDLLVGLDLLTRLGYAGDPRLAPALEWLRGRR